jgi:alpha-beta hydrolase superfamily lysophospholipase
VRRALVVVLVVVVAVTGLLWAFQRRLVYLPQGTPGPVPAGAREVELTTSDGLRLGAWFFPGDDDAALAVLVANGNGGHRGLRTPLAHALHDEGLAVLLFDYRGYGGNPGSPSEDGLARDVRAAREFLLEETTGPLLYFGESLGAAVVTELATEHPPAGLVLRSPFTDLAAVGSHHYPFLPVRALLRDRYPVAEGIVRVHVPTTVVYGTGDTIVPPEQSRAVADAAPGLREVVAVPSADHNDPVLTDGPDVVRAVVELTG